MKTTIKQQAKSIKNITEDLIQSKKDEKRLSRAINILQPILNIAPSVGNTEDDNTVLDSLLDFVLERSKYTFKDQFCSRMEFKLLES